MTKEEYIKRFIAHVCEVAALAKDDELAVVEAECWWDDHASGDATLLRR